MNFQTAVTTCFNKYVTFTGRAARSEYWFFMLFTVLVQIAVEILERLLGTGIIAIVGLLIYLVLFLPGLAVSVRRLHDKDKSGWFILLSFIPVIGLIVLLYWFCTPGTPGGNQYGPDPLAGSPPSP